MVQPLADEQAQPPSSLTRSSTISRNLRHPPDFQFRHQDVGIDRFADRARAVPGGVCIGAGKPFQILFPDAVDLGAQRAGCEFFVGEQRRWHNHVGVHEVKRHFEFSGPLLPPLLPDPHRVLVADHQ